MSQNEYQAADQRQAQLGVNPDDPASFINLPLELRRKIWKHAAVSQPRFIQLKICDVVHKWNPRASGLEYQIPKESFPTVLLKACSESQDIIKENYKYTTFLGSPLCYDPDIDVLWVRGIPILSADQQFDLDGSRFGGCTGALFEQKAQPPIRSYLFRSVALDFAGIKESHKDFVTSTQSARDFRPAIFYGISRMEVEKIYIVYSSGDPRDEVDREVEDFIDKLKILGQRGSAHHQWIRKCLTEKNERDGTNLTEWTPTSVEAILDTKLISGTNDPN